MIKPFLSLHK